jgi:hypothetical protein
VSEPDGNKPTTTDTAATPSGSGSTVAGWTVSPGTAVTIPATLLGSLGVVGTQQPLDKFDDVRLIDMTQDIKLKKRYANGALIIMGIQILVADAVFAWYGDANEWDIPVAAISLWLTAAVVEVIGVALVVARYLFPRRENS